MKTQFEKLEERKGLFSHAELRDLVDALVFVIINTDNRLISVDKKRVGYGTWSSVGFANNYCFGNKLAELIKQALTGRITHDEDKDFVVADFEENIADALFDYLF
jgi:hypothetical protein